MKPVSSWIPLTIRDRCTCLSAADAVPLGRFRHHTAAIIHSWSSKQGIWGSPAPKTEKLSGLERRSERIAERIAERMSEIC